jgi:hypothetical protein
MNYKFILCLSRILFLVLWLITVPYGLKAQQQGRVKDSIYRKQLGREQPIKAIFKTSVLSPFYWQIPLTGEYRLVGEFMIAPKQSIQIGASYLTRSIFFTIMQKMTASSGSAKVAMNGYRLQASYKYYFFNKKFRPEGMYLSLHTSFASQKVNFKDYPEDYQLLQHFNLNLLVGGQVIIRNRVSLELFLGPGYKNNSYISHSRKGYEVFIFEELSPTLYSHLKFNLGINIGVVL